MLMQRDIKDVDLNKSHYSSAVDVGNDGAQDEILRKRL